MDLKQLKATVQLAEMRFNVDPSDSNKALFTQAKDAYENAKNPESPAKTKVEKNDQISGKSDKPGKKEKPGKEEPAATKTVETGKDSQDEDAAAAHESAQKAGNDQLQAAESPSSETNPEKKTE